MSKPRVLLVDDEPHLTAGLKRALRREPYEVLAAVSGTEALEIMEKSPVDVVVSDEQMPGMPGSELLARIRKRYPDTVRMVLTGQASLEAAIRAINEGRVYRFFTKPVDAVDLATTIRHALQHRRLMRESRRLLATARAQASHIERLEREAPGISRVDRDAEGAIVLDEDRVLATDVQRLIEEMSAAATHWRGGG